MKLLISLCLALIAFSTYAAEPGVRFPQPTRLLAIGDIHGDATSLRQILFNLNLIDDQDNWTGGSANLVFTGDYLDRGVESREALDLLMKIMDAAPHSGGRVICLMGNHEFMDSTGDLRYFSKTDALNYKDFASQPGDTPRQMVTKAFAPGTRYGRFISNLPAMAIVGDTVFAHGGIEEWADDVSIEDVNLAIHNWLNYYQGLGPKPDPKSAWVVGDQGPFWTRVLADSPEDIPEPVLRHMLQTMGVNHIVVGHTITETRRAEVRTPDYGDQLVRIDSAISSAIGGNLSAVEWTKDATGHSFYKAYAFARPPALKPVIHFFEQDGLDYVPKFPHIPNPFKKLWDYFFPPESPADGKTGETAPPTNGGTGSASLVKNSSRTPASDDQWTAPVCNDSKEPLFQSEEPLELTLKGSFPLAGNVMNHYNYGQPLNAESPGELDFMDHGQMKALPIKLAARGKSRLMDCKFKPVRIAWDTDKAVEKERKHTLFGLKGQDMKLVVHCKYTSGTIEQNPEANEYVIEEYMLYKILQALNLPTFKVRLTKANYINSDNGNTVEGMGFLIEPSAAWAERCGLKHVKYDDIKKSLENIDKRQYIPYLLSRIIVDASDYVVDIGHNTEPFTSADSPVSRAIVPYDFNDSSLVQSRGEILNFYWGIDTSLRYLQMGPFARDGGVTTLTADEATQWKQTLVQQTKMILDRKQAALDAIEKAPLNATSKAKFRAHIENVLTHLSQMLEAIK